MLKKYVWLKNAVFLLLFSYLAAQIGNRIILMSLPAGDLPDERAKPSAVAKGTAKSNSLQSYKVISARNIFNSEFTGEEVVAPGAVTSNAPLKKSDLNVKLIGTVAGGRESSFAVIEDLKTNQQDLFRVDDVIQDVARVLEIGRCRAVVLRDGAREILECPEDEERKAQKTAVSTGPQSGTPAADQGGTVKKVSETEYLIDESEVQNAMENMNDLLTQVRVVPNFQDGKANGFKVFAIKPNSIFSKIGLRNGDVIQKINDRDIASPDRAFQAFQDLRNEKSLSVEIVRRGGPQTLHYEIR